MRFFVLLGAICLTMVGLVVLAGGVVRATGAGMGCPDWPKCFGLWIPPTDASQLPADYRIRFNVHGHGVEPFNVYKTWTEYLNRLLGAAAGLAVAGFALGGALSDVSRRAKLLALAAVVLMAFQGWLGAKVVDSNLAPLMVTVHMVVALAIVLTLMTAIHAARPFAPLDPVYFKHAAALTALIFLQTALGTRVREAVDEQTFAGAERSTWIEGAGAWFYVHRSFSWLMLIHIAYLIWRFRKTGSVPRSLKTAAAVAAAVSILGATMHYADVPVWAQPLHLLGAVLLASAIFYFLLQTVHVRHRNG
ncbi:MAG: COX15/CtaA family protein [Bacteroidia bacterium]|nr:COX15/CtaA family protein [Bacteroidia bacterium]MDW8334017.1 COX15/CtaA family protein [Bacteroidia bacterium]